MEYIPLSSGLSHKIRIPAMLTNKYSGNTYSHFLGIDFWRISVPQYLFVSIAGIRILWDRPLLKGIYSIDGYALIQEAMPGTYLDIPLRFCVPKHKANLIRIYRVTYQFDDLVGLVLISTYPAYRLRVYKQDRWKPPTGCFRVRGYFDTPLNS